MNWKDNNKDFSYNEQIQLEIDETKQALLCPATGKIMRKLRISTTTEHRIDYSASVGGVWLDKGEWELLKKRAWQVL